MRMAKFSENRLFSLLTCAVVTAAIATAAAPSSSAAASAGSKAAAARVLLASDEFTGAAGTAPNPWIWTSLQGGGGWGNHELQSYTARASNVSLDGAGDLSITARKEAYTGADHITSQYTSARLISQAAMMYGYAEARIYLPAGQGLWPAFWTIGADVYQGVPWPVTGEIDIMEAYNQMQSVWGTVHGPTTAGAAYGLPTQYTPGYSLSGSWHTYGIDWTAGSITWYLDGTAYHTLNKSDLPTGDVWEFSKPHRLQLDLAVGGDGPGAPSPVAFPARMLVDYVRVFSN